MNPQEKLRTIQEIKNPALKEKRLLAERLMSLESSIESVAKTEGPTGAKGEKGDKGDIGQQGPDGFQGIRGEQGPTGLMGPRGLQGEVGPQGEKGVPGKDGRDGKDGVSPNIEDLVKEVQKTPVHLKDIKGTDKLIEYLKSGGFRGGGGSGGGSSITLQTNGTNNASQSLLNLIGSGKTTVTNTGGGNVTITTSDSITIGTTAISGGMAGTVLIETGGHKIGELAYTTSSVASTLVERDASGFINANSFITTGGLSTDFVKGDGSLDSNTYITSAGAPVQSVFGRTGSVIAQSGDYNTSLVTENTNLYFTDARAITALTGQNISIFNNDSGYITSAGAPIQDVSNSDGSLTVTPTTGSVVASLNVGHTNTWTAAQTFRASTTLGAASTANGTLLFKGTTSGTVTMTTANAAGTWTMTLPTTAGTNAFVLQTNGSGVTSWVTKAPTLTSQQVGFGNGSNVLTGSTKFLWDDSNAGTLTFSGNGSGSPVSINSGAVGGVPANFQFLAANAGAGTDLPGGTLYFLGGNGDGLGNGGDVLFTSGAGVVSGVISFADGNTSLKGSLSMALLNGDRTFQFPDTNGRFVVDINDTDLTGQTAAITTTTLFTPPKIGMYRITIYLQVTRAATISSILGGATGVVLTYKDGDGNVTQTDTVGLTAPNGTVVTTLNTNTTATNLTGSIEIYCKTNAVTYAIGYTSAGTTAMAYAAHLRVEAL